MYPYAGGVMIFLIIITLIAAAAAVSQSPTLQTGSVTLEGYLEQYEAYCRNLTDNELIAEYYQLDVDLQEALDDLRKYEGPLSEPVPFYRGNWARRQTMRNIARFGEALGRAIASKPIREQIKMLREQIALVLTIMHQRGLALPMQVR